MTTRRDTHYAYDRPQPAPSGVVGKLSMGVGGSPYPSPGPQVAGRNRLYREMGV